MGTSLHFDLVPSRGGRIVLTSGRETPGSRDGVLHGGGVGTCPEGRPLGVEMECSMGEGWVLVQKGGGKGHLGRLSDCS